VLLIGVGYREQVLWRVLGSMTYWIIERSCGVLHLDFHAMLMCQ
jgi:hypothetical protein